MNDTSVDAIYLYVIFGITFGLYPAYRAANMDPNALPRRAELEPATFGFNVLFLSVLSNFIFVLQPIRERLGGRLGCGK